MKNPIKKNTIHAISDDLSKIKTVVRITFFGITVFKSSTCKSISINLF